MNPDFLLRDIGATPGAKLSEYYVCPPWHSGDTFNIRAIQDAPPRNVHVRCLGVFESRARIELAKFIKETGITPSTDPCDRHKWKPSDEAPPRDDSPRTRCLITNPRLLRCTVEQLRLDLGRAGFPCNRGGMCGDHWLWSKVFPQHICFCILSTPAGQVTLTIYTDKHKVREIMSVVVPKESHDLLWVAKHLTVEAATAHA